MPSGAFQNLKKQTNLATSCKSNCLRVLGTTSGINPSFINNLSIYTSDLIFHCDQNDTYYFLSADITDKIDLNTKSLMNYDNVVEKFLYLVAQDYRY